MNRAQLKQNAKLQIKGKIGILFVINLVIAALSFLASLTGLGAIIVLPVFSFSLTYIYLGIAKGNGAELGDAFYGFRDFGGALGVYLLTALFGAFWAVLGAIPGLVKSIAYSQAGYIRAEDKNVTTNEAICKSRALMYGHKWEYFKLELSFIWWHLLAALTGGWLYIWLTPYIETTKANFYAAINKELTKEEITYLCKEENRDIGRLLLILLAVAIFTVGAILFDGGGLVQAGIGSLLMIGLTPLSIVLALRNW